MSAQKNIGASVRARLLNRARDSGSDYGLILTKYALERILYRLSVSQWRDAFVLKGALLFDLWFDHPHRPTLVPGDGQPWHREHASQRLL